MASHPVSACCKYDAIHKGTPIGTFETFGKVDTYVSGDKSAPIVLLYLTDIFGHKFVNNQLIADEFGKNGIYTIMPDLFGGDALPLDFDFSKIGEWKAKHAEAGFLEIVDNVLAQIKKEFPSQTIATIGYCFGARYTMKLLNGQVDVGAVAHPTNVSIEDVEAATAPLLIMAAETDSSYPPEKRAETEHVLKDGKKTYFTTLASGVSHGFAIKGDPSIPAVKLAKEKAFADALWWFQSAHKKLL